MQSFLFITGFVRALEKRYLAGEMIRSLIERPDPQNAREVLRATYFREWLPEGEDSLPLETFLHRSREWVLLMARQYGAEELETIFRIPRDYHNIRTVLRGLVFRQAQAGMTSPEGTLPAGLLRSLLEEGRFDELPGSMGQAAREALDVYGATKSTLLMDCFLDRWLTRDLLSLAGRTGSSMIMKHQRLSIDIANVGIFLRAGDLLLNGNVAPSLFLKGGHLEIEMFRSCRSVAELAVELERDDIHVPLSRGVKEYAENPFAPEREGDGVLLGVVDEARYVIDGPDPLYAFLCRVDWEIRVLGMILSAGIAGREYIRMRLEGLL